MDTRQGIRRVRSAADRRRLLQALESTSDARLYRRLQALVEVSEGQPIAAVARRLRVDRSTVHRWLERYRGAREPGRLAERARSGRPRMAAALTEPILRKLLTSDPRDHGFDATTWTVPLLTSHLRSHGITISARTLRRRIREARFRWKRPRYVYHERADHVGAKKGGSFDA